MGSNASVQTKRSPQVTHSVLINMGFDEITAYTASQKHCTDINKALNYIIGQRAWDQSTYSNSHMSDSHKVNKPHRTERKHQLLPVKYNNAHNLGYDSNYNRFPIKSNNDNLKLVFAFCHFIQENYLTTFIPYDVILRLSKFCFNESFDVCINDNELKACIHINERQNTVSALPHNSISTIYGNIIVNDNDFFSWTLHRNKFSDLNRNFFIGIIRNDIDWLFEHIHVCGWTQHENGYFIDLVSLMNGSEYLHNHNIDVRIQITLNLNEGLLYFYLLIDGKIINHYKISQIRKGEYRLAVCLFGEGTEIQIC